MILNTSKSLFLQTTSVIDSKNWASLYSFLFVEIACSIALCCDWWCFCDISNCIHIPGNSLLISSTELSAGYRWIWLSMEYNRKQTEANTQLLLLNKLLENTSVLSLDVSEVLEISFHNRKDLWLSNHNWFCFERWMMVMARTLE